MKYEDPQPCRICGKPKLIAGTTFIDRSHFCDCVKTESGFTPLTDLPRKRNNVKSN